VTAGGGVAGHQVREVHGAAPGGPSGSPRHLLAPPGDGVT
jgi:hypothetical protein